MKKLIQMTVAGLAAMLVVGVGLAVAHNKTYDTTTSIKFVGSDYGDKFNGKVKSEKDACQDKRKVTVFRNRDDEKIGEDTTGEDGKWNVELGTFAEAGKYHAEVKKRTLDKNKKHKHVCGSTESGNVTAGP
jgi:hypothetical protein